MTSRMKIAQIFCVSVCSLLCSLTQAQTAPQIQSPEAAVLGEVIVTARKLSENVQNVPVAITALSGEELKAANIRTLYQIQEEVPSLLFQSAVDDPQSLTVTLRGRSQNDVTLGVDPAVGLYVDGLYFPRTLGMAGSLVDIGQVAVLRGPQGTLYGRNTTGGALTVNTNDPTDQEEGSVDLTGGNYGAWNVIGIANIPITEDVDARFVVQRGRHLAYGHDLAGDPLASEDSQYFRVKVLAKLSDSVRAVLSAHFESNESGGPIEKLIGIAPAGGGAPAGGAATLEYAAEAGLTNDRAAALMQSYVDRSNTAFYDTSGNFPTYSIVRRWDTALKLTGELPASMTWQSITGVQVLRRLSQLGTPWPGNAIKVDLDTQDRYYSEELQLIRNGAQLDWVAGLYGGIERGQDDGLVYVLPALGVPSGTNNSGIRNQSLAAFGQSVWEFIPTWRLTLGARYSSDERQANNIALSGTACVVPAPGVESTLLGPAQCPRNFKDTFSRPTWLVSLDHKFTPDILVYAKAATGYRSGGQNTGGAVEVETFAPFRPETNIEYEVGVKSQAFDERLRLDFAVYHDRYSNLQVTTNFTAADGQIATAVTNAATAGIQGFEADAKLVVTPQLSVNASAAFTDAHYTHFQDFTGDRSHQAFPVPKWAGVVGAKYIQPTPAGNLDVVFDYAWRSKEILDGTALDLNDLTQKAYGVLNGRIDLEISALDLNVAVFGNNITGTKYYDNATAHDASLGVNFGYAGAPATFGVEVIKRFGGK
jgi:iron complex outermembrane receptor protein